MEKTRRKASIISITKKEKENTMKTRTQALLISLIFLGVACLSLVFCGIVYASNDASDANGNATEISALAGRSYRVVVYLKGFPMLFPTVYSFDESGNFTAFERLWGEPTTENSGYYTQTGSLFTAHSEFRVMGVIPHAFDCEGISVLDIFIYGNATIQGEVDDVVTKSEGVFIGILKLFQVEAE